MTGLRILITGSREWTDRDVIRDAIVREGRASGLSGQDTTIVHGAARGADLLAADVAREFNCRIEAHPADWDRYGKSAGHHRNAEMVALGADVCLAFPLPGARGTWDCVRKAKAAGIPVTVYEGEPA